MPDPTLAAWLSKVNASEYWRIPVPGFGAITCNIINGHQLLILHHHHSQTFTLYKPVSRSSGPKTQFHAAEQFCSLLGPRTDPPRPAA